MDRHGGGGDGGGQQEEDIWVMPYFSIAMTALNIQPEMIQALGPELVFEMNFTELGATTVQVAGILNAFQTESNITIPTEHVSKVTSIKNFLIIAMHVSVATSINGLGLDGIGTEYGTGPSDFGELDTFSSLGLSEQDIYDASKAATDPFSPTL